jgi:flagellar hook-associated protein 2
MALSSPGIGSGLDVKGLVAQLMTIEQRPLELLKTRATTVQAKISAFGQVKSYLDALRTAASDLANAASWNTKAATLSDSSVASVSATAASPTGSYSLEVTHLALPHRLASDPYADSATVVGTGSLTIEVGKWTGASFAPASGTTPVVITVDATNNSLAGIRDAVNTANAGVRASIVTDNTGARLVFTSTATGTAQAMRITAADDDGNNTDPAGLSALAYAGDTTPAAPGAKQVQAGQDARLLLDGLAIVNSTNTVSGAIEGVTLTLAGTNAGKPATLTLAPDAGGARKLAEKFIGAYNSSVVLLANMTKADPTGAANGVLQSDQAARSLASALRSLATRMLPSGTLTSLSQTGISLKTDGTLAIDDTRFNAATASGTTAIAALFSTVNATESNQGIAVRFKAALDTALGTEGTVNARTVGLQATLKANQRDQQSLTTRLTAVEARLKKQYTSLDMLLGNLSTVSSTLTQSLAQLQSLQNNK